MTMLVWTYGVAPYVFQVKVEKRWLIFVTMYAEWVDVPLDSLLLCTQAYRVALGI